MEPLQPGQVICPRCGYDNSYYHNGESFLREGMILNGKYMVGRFLGKGGFGITYLGVDLNLRIKVAIKEYFPGTICTRSDSLKPVQVFNDAVGNEGFQKGRRVFFQEAQTLAMFNSRSIAHIREFFNENSTSYIVMDYVDGIGLDAAIRKNGGRLPWQKVIRLSKGLMPELDMVHRKNLVHRDIKPQNIKIVADPYTGEERMVLLDFGSARSFVSSEVTGTYTTVLTPGFAPIEQYQRKSHQGPFTDVYGLCATMYTAITGTVLPPSPDLILGETKIEPFERFALNIPAGIEKAIMHGLEPRSRNRPQTMRALLDEISQAEIDLPGQNPANIPAGRVLPITNLKQELSSAAYLKKGSFSGLKTGAVLRFGQFPQGNRSELSFIEWQILSIENRRALLISKHGLESKAYHNSSEPVNWDTCSLRKWLNVDFYNKAFSDQEKRLIMNVRNQNPDNPSYSTKGGEDTWDRLFLLSIDEVNQYFSNEQAQVCSATAYAKSHNVNINNRTGNSWWWLRTPGSSNKNASYVLTLGSVSSYGIIVNSVIGAVRPAFWLDLTK